MASSKLFSKVPPGGATPGSRSSSRPSGTKARASQRLLLQHARFLAAQRLFVFVLRRLGFQLISQGARRASKPPARTQSISVWIAPPFLRGILSAGAGPRSVSPPALCSACWHYCSRTRELTHSGGITHFLDDRSVETCACNPSCPQRLRVRARKKIATLHTHRACTHAHTEGRTGRGRARCKHIRLFCVAPTYAGLKLLFSPSHGSESGPRRQRGNVFAVVALSLAPFPRSV